MASSPQEPERPSTWKLLFGKNKSHHDDHENNNAEERQEYQTGPQKRPQGASPPRHSPNDVTQHFLTALHTRERGEDPQELLGRECSEQLLGKPNAFAPQLRIDETTASDGDASRAAAREIICARFQVEKRAQAIREGKTQEKLRRDDSRLRPAKATRTDAATTTGMEERLAKLRDIQVRRDAREALRLQEEKLKQKKAKVVDTKPEVSRASRVTTTKVSARVRQIPDYRSAKAAAETKRVATAARPTEPESKSVKKALVKADGRSNQEESPRPHGGNVSQTIAKAATAHAKPSEGNGVAPSTREYRLIDEKLRQLKAENQHVEALEAKLQTQQKLLQIKRRVWALWRERVDGRHRQVVSVTRAFQWRQLQRVWGKWRSYARTTRREREAEQTRAAMVRDKQNGDAAERFYRRKQLPPWFLQWRSVVSAMKEARAFDREMNKRREQAQRLMERFARTAAPGSKGEERDMREEDDVPVAVEPVKTRQKAVSQQKDPSTRRDHATNSRLRPKAAWAEADGAANAEMVAADTKTPTTASLPLASSVHQTKPKGQPSPDAFYVSMQERAEQRKQQREQLKHKYEQQELAKREALAIQVAEREALLERQKQEERERLRQKKREEARLAREKATAREVEAIKQQSAQLHDRMRLLFHYAWRPWHAQWLTSKRIARNATQWHDLRVSHRVWLAWGRYVDQRRAERRQIERERLHAATQQYQLTLLRRSLEAWKQARAQTQRRELALRRQTQWNEMSRSWRRWHQQYALVLSEQHHQELRVRSHLNRTRLRSVVTAWRQAAVETKRERVRQAEKELLWKKARGWLNER